MTGTDAFQVKEDLRKNGRFTERNVGAFHQFFNKIIYRHSTNQITDFWRCRFTRSYFWYFDFISTKDTYVISCSLLFSLYSLQRWLFQYLYGQNLTNDRPPNGVRMNVNNTMHRPVNGKMIPPALRRNGLPKMIGKHSAWQGANLESTTAFLSKRIRGRSLVRNINFHSYWK